MLFSSKMYRACIIHLKTALSAAAAAARAKQKAMESDISDVSLSASPSMAWYSG